MKRFEDFTKEDLWALRNEVVVNSVFDSDYNNSFGLSTPFIAFRYGFVELDNPTGEDE